MNRTKGQSYNNRLDMKSDIQVNKMYGINNHSKNLDRLNLERDNLFNQDSKHTDLDSMGRIKNGIGEITGSMFDGGHNLRGLPMRPQFSAKKEIYDANEHLDFDLYSSKKSNLNVKYFDPNDDNNISGNYADISSSMTKISSQVNPVTICSNGIDRINNNSFYYLFDLLENQHYVINGFGLYNLFASLYLSSENRTDVELKKFFDFPKKDILFKGLNNINKVFDNVLKTVTIKNFLIVGNDVPYNPNYYDTVKDFCILIRADISRPSQEANKINMLIKKITENNDIKTCITSENLINLQLMFLTVAIFHPVWETSFDNVVNGLFMKQIKTNFLISVGKSFGYFEDNNHQLLEIRCNNNEMTFGILLHKSEMVADVDDIKLHYYISNLKESILDEVRIPMFKDDSKLRFNSSLKNMGLQTVFMDIISPDFFPEGIVLQDVVQNVKIIIDNTYRKESENINKGYRTSRKFIADKPFIYYFRLVKTDTILLLGTYNVNA